MQGHSALFVIFGLSLSILSQGAHAGTCSKVAMKAMVADAIRRSETMKPILVPALTGPQTTPSVDLLQDPTAILNFIQDKADPTGQMTRFGKSAVVHFTAEGGVLSLALTNSADRGGIRPDHFSGKSRLMLVGIHEPNSIVYGYPTAQDKAVWSDGGDTVSIFREGRLIAERKDIRQDIERRSRRVMAKVRGQIETGHIFTEQEVVRLWNWDELDIIYFLFYAIREYVVSPIPAFLQQHADILSVSPVRANSFAAKTYHAAYELKVKLHSRHGHSRFQDIYYNKDGILCGLEYNFDPFVPLDTTGDKAPERRLPIVHAVDVWEPGHLGIQGSKNRKAWPEWDRILARMLGDIQNEQEKVENGVIGATADLFDALPLPLFNPGTFVQGEIKRGIKRAKQSAESFVTALKTFFLRNHNYTNLGPEVSMPVPFAAMLGRAHQDFWILDTKPTDVARDLEKSLPTVGSDVEAAKQYFRSGRFVIPEPQRSTN